MTRTPMHLHVACYTDKTCDAMTGEKEEEDEHLRTNDVRKKRSRVRVAGPMIKDCRSGERTAFD